MYDYFAFISYSRRDLQVAKRLQADLEWFRIPIGVERPADVAGHRKYIRPVALDKTDLDLRPASFWSDIEQRLANSRYLILLCSPNSAASENVDREVRHFLNSRNDAHESVVPVIVAGKPNSEDAASECLPPALRRLLNPIVHRNLPTLVDSTREEMLLQVVSFLLDVKFSTINDRYQNERRRRMRRLAAVAMAATVVFALIAGYAFFQRAAAIQQAFRAQTNELRALELAQRNKDLAIRESAARAQAQRDEVAARAEADAAKRSDYASRIALAQNETSVGNMTHVRTLLNGCPPELRRFEWYRLYRAIDTSVIKFVGHQGIVEGLSESTDGSRIASWGRDNTARVWEIGKLESIRTLRRDDPRITTAALSGDGKRIALGLWGGKIEICDVDDGGRTLHRWSVRSKAHDISDIGSVLLSSDGKRLVVALINPLAVRVYDVETSGQVLQNFKGQGPIAISADGTRLAAVAGPALESVYINIFDMDSGQQLMKLVGHQGNVTSMGLSADGKRLVSCSSDDSVKIWDVEKGGAALRTIRGGGHVVDVHAVAISDDGKHFVSAHDDKTIRLWDFDKEADPIKIFRGHEQYIEAVLLSRDGSSVVSAGVDSTIRVWNVKRADESQRVMSGSQLAGTQVAISGDGRRIAAASWDNSVKLWDSEDERAPLQTLNGHANHVVCVAFSGDGSRIVSGGFDQTGIVWDARSGAELFRLKGHTGTLNAVAISGDNKRIATSGWGDGTIRIWDGERAGSALYELHAPRRMWFKTVALSADGSRVIAGLNNGAIKVFEPQLSAVPLFTLNAHKGEIDGIVLSPDAKRIYSCGDDSMIRVWSAEKAGDALMTFSGHTNGVAALAISGDGKRVVSSGGDRTIRIWDAEHAGEALLTLTSPELYPYSVAMSRDGMRIVSGAFDETVRVWDAGQIADEMSSTTRSAP